MKLTKYEKETIILTSEGKRIFSQRTIKIAIRIKYKNVGKFTHS